MKSAGRILLLAGAVSLSGCYHATINTGIAPSATQIIERDWAHSWLGGLVPPDDLDVADQCPNGVARVETELSLLNQIAAGLTFGIYTPMTIKVTCGV